MSPGPNGHFGSLAAFALGPLTFTFVALLFVAADPALRDVGSAWPYLAADYVLAVVGLAGLAAVPAFSARFVHYHAEFVRWIGTVATLGFAVLTVTSFWQADYESTLQFEAAATPAGGYLDAPSGALAFVADLYARLPKGWLEVGGVALWILGLSWLARDASILTQGQIGLGTVTGIFGLSVPLLGALQLTDLAMVAQFIYGLLGAPIWFMWVGSHFLDERAADAPPKQAVAPATRTLPSPLHRRHLLTPSLRRWVRRRIPVN